MGLNMNFDFLKRKPQKEDVAVNEAAKMSSPEKIEISDAEKAKSLSAICVEYYEKEKGQEVTLSTKTAVENALLNAFAKGLIKPEAINEIEKFVYDKIESVTKSLEKIDQVPVGRAKEAGLSAEAGETSLLGKVEFGKDEDYR